MNRTDRIIEAMNLLQEESGEIVQAVSKIRRFGRDFRGRGGEDRTAHENFQREVWDTQILLGILQEEGYIDLTISHDYWAEKYEKLKKWTSLYDDDN